MSVVLRGAAFVLLVAVSVAVLRWTTRDRSGSRDQWNLPAASSSYSIQLPRAPEVRARNKRLVYPYSVVPGGVASGKELQAAAAHDAVVARHFSGFDYSRARIIPVKQPRKVYLSYRLGNRIFWTRDQAFLRTGELLLTDGTTTARTRCGNQVSVLPQAATSPEQPTMAELDRPDAVASGIEMAPANVTAGLLHVDPAMPFGPGASASGFAGGPPVGGIPAPLGGGGGGGGGGPNPPPPPPPPPPAPTPEPGTIVLIGSGAALVFARYRKR